MWAGFMGELEPDRFGICWMLDADIVEEIKRWALWWFLEMPSGVFSAYLSSPSHLSPSQILNWKTQSYARGLPASCQLRVFGEIQDKDSKAFLLPTSPDIVGLWATSVLAPWPTCLSSPCPACSCLRAFALAVPSPWKALNGDIRVVCEN